MTRVCLVAMPFAAVERPSLALGLLQALLEREGIPCRTLYANVEWARRVGPDRYAFWEETLGDVIFAWCSEDPRPYMAWRLENRRARARQLGLPDDLVGLGVRLRAEAAQFAVEVAREAVATGATIFGCSSTFWQQTASLAVLREIRRLSPSAVTMLGGANCEGAMGRAVHRLFPWVDYVVSGEPDDWFAAWCASLPSGELPPGVYGPTHRVHGYPDPPPRALCSDLDALPTPQYRDYFAALETTGLDEVIRPGLPVETSRGCWWGQVHQCRFCGTSAPGRLFRSKSPDRVLAEFAELQHRHGVGDFETADSILDMDYFRTVLPRLGAPGRRIFWEVKANLKRAQVEGLARAGVTWIQPGIEALDSRILRLVDKGVSAAQNLLLLKWCRELGIGVSWNLLWGFPGEEDAWHAETARLLPRLVHLQPPRGIIRLRFDRFSRYQEQPEEFGLRLRPARYMRLAYGLPERDLAELSYFFEPAEAMAPGGPGVRSLAEGVARWSERFWTGIAPVLSLTDDGEALEFLDSRELPARTLRVDGELRQAYLRAEDGLPQDAAGEVARLVELGLLLPLEGRVLGLGVRGNLPRTPAWTRFPGGHVDVVEVRRRRAQDRAGSGALL